MAKKKNPIDAGLRWIAEGIKDIIAPRGYYSNKRGDVKYSYGMKRKRR